MPKLTETEQKIYDLLSDGRDHNRYDVKDSFGDEFTTQKCLRVHLSNMRKKLNPAGIDIVCSWNGRAISYRMVRMLKS